MAARILGGTVAPMRVLRVRWKKLLPNLVLKAFMSTSHSVSSPVSLHRMIDGLYRSFVTALAEQCVERGGARVTVRRKEDSSDGGPSIQVQLVCSNLIWMPVRFTIRPNGERLYDVECAVEEGPSRQFTYTLPNQGQTEPSRMPSLGQELATFLLDELEERFGQRLLHGPLHPPVQGAAWVSPQRTSFSPGPDASP